MGFTTFLTGWPALGVAALYIAWVLVAWLKYPNAPGPLLARFSNIWFAYRMKKGHFEKENIELHRKYGMSCLASMVRTKCVLSWWECSQAICVAWLL